MKKIREWYECDRCSAEIEKPHHGGEAGTFRLVFERDFAVAGDHTGWRELCRECNEYIGNLIEREIAKATRKDAK